MFCANLHRDPESMVNVSRRGKCQLPHRASDPPGTAIESPIPRDMSLAGPRPLLRELPDDGAVISLYERVRPGVTGLW